MDHDLQVSAAELGRILGAADGSLNPIELAVKNALREKYPDPSELKAIEERAVLHHTKQMVEENAAAAEDLPSVSVAIRVRNRL